MVDAALNVAAEQVIEHSAYGSAAATRGQPRARPPRRRTCTAPARLDEFGRPDDWVAIAVATDEQWASLRRRARRTRTGRRDELATPTGRRRHHERSTSSCAAWCGDRTGDEIVDNAVGRRRASGQGDAAAPVRPSLPQLAHRGFFEQVEHPVNGRPPGTARCRCGSRRGPQRFHRTPAPLLGQHNHEVLSGLGLDRRRDRRLEDEGIIGTAPAMRGIRTTKTG